MADQTVPEQQKRYGHADALANLRQTAKAAGIVRVISLAVTGLEQKRPVQVDMDLVRWAPSVDAAAWCLNEVKTSLINSIDSPSSVDWCTPLSLLDGMAAAFWRTDVPEAKALRLGDVEGLCDAVLDSLATLHSDLSVVASNLAREAAQSAGASVGAAYGRDAA